MVAQVNVSLEDVRRYLNGCEECTVYSIIRILKHSLMLGKDASGKDRSASYVVSECEKIDPNSPLVKLLKQNESAWPQIMTVGDEIVDERDLDIKKLYE